MHSNRLMLISIRREDLAEFVSIASSIVSSIQQPDPSEAGLFNAPQRPRLRNYQMLSGAYTYALTHCYLASGGSFGDQVVLDRRQHYCTIPLWCLG